MLVSIRWKSPFLVSSLTDYIHTVSLPVRERRTCALPMFLADFLGKEDQPFVAADLSPAVASNPSRVLFPGFAVGVLTAVFDFLQYYRHPVIPVRFDGQDTGIESRQRYARRVGGYAIDELLPGLSAIRQLDIQIPPQHPLECTLVDGYPGFTPRNVAVLNRF